MIYEEQAIRALMTTLQQDLPDILAEVNAMNGGELPDVGPDLTLPKEWIYGETPDVTTFPTIVAWTTADYSRDQLLAYPVDRTTQEAFVDAFMDVYLEWDKANELFFRLLRYKHALRECLKRNPTLNGVVKGITVVNSLNSNLYSEGRNLNQATRQSVRIWTTDEW